MNTDYFWKFNFPPIYKHTSLSFLKNCKGFTDAKNGNMESAKSVINCCVKQHRLNSLMADFPHAVLLPVITDNKLPLALAEKIGLSVNNNVRQTNIEKRKNLSAAERLLHAPKFEGKIDKNVNYIIVDDIITQGGTVAELRKYVISNGGTVCAVAVLAHALCGGMINPSEERLQKISVKFNTSKITETLNRHNIVTSVYELTEQQITYLLKFKQLVKIEKKLASYANAA